MLFYDPFFFQQYYDFFDILYCSLPFYSTNYNYFLELILYLYTNTKMILLFYIS